MRLKHSLLAGVWTLGLISSASAACERFSLSGEAEPKFTEGTISAISATGVSKVRGKDPTEVATAMKSASLKARGALVRYLSQDVTADQLQESLNGFQESTSNGTTTVDKVDLERTAEVIRSKAGDILKGATPVAECYDADRDLAFVKIGVSDTITAALGGFRSATQAERTQAQPEPPKSASGNSFEKRSPNASLFE